jgi:large subunit ribosomal protein L18
MAFNKVLRRKKIRKSIRGKVNGTSDRPRVSVFKSNKGIYAQIINDVDGKTLVAASSMEISPKPSANVVSSKEVGAILAKKASTMGITNVVFDRGGYIYHGRVKALAEGAREGGLNF